ncbi:S-adenosylmethionine-dependent methyltransferase [Sorochytrium milnesiophthora]
MLPTPDLSHIKSADYDQVYEPAEDTFLLMDALESDWAWLRARLGDNAQVCLEVGPGSGCVSTFCAMHFFKQCAYLAVDINPRASAMTVRTAMQNKVVVEAVQGYLLTPFLRRLHRSVDVLIFNPPYVPTPSEEVYWPQAGRNETDEIIAASWAGGERGREVIDCLIPTVQDILSDVGVFYMVLLKQNRPEEVAERMRAAGGFLMEIVAARKAGREHLLVAKFYRH